MGGNDVNPMSAWDRVKSISNTTDRIPSPDDTSAAGKAVSVLQLVISKYMTRLPVLYLLFLVFIALFGKSIAPYEYNERVTSEGGSILIAQPPSVEHPLGTTGQGYDVLSRVIVGTQPTIIAGFLGGAMIVSIGLAVALTAGYIGGQVDSLLMRITDIFYSIPLIPFAVVVLAFFGGGYFVSIFIIGVLLWRGNARVIRAQVLQIKERPYIAAAKASGAGSLRIVTKHILPNVLPMAMLYFAIGIGAAIIAQASLAFVGVGNPFLPSWGVMIRNAYNSGYLSIVWTWSVVPGMLIALTVLSCFLIGRSFETDDEAEAGAI